MGTSPQRYLSIIDNMDQWKNPTDTPTTNPPGKRFISMDESPVNTSKIKVDDPTEDNKLTKAQILQKYASSLSDKPYSSDHALQAGGNFLANSMPAAGGAIATPETFGLGTLPGIAAGSMVKRGLQTISPKYFGKPPEDLTGDAVDTATDMIGNSLPYAGAGIANLASQPRKTIASMFASRFLNNSPAIQKAVGADVSAGASKFLTPESMSIETAAENARNNPNLQNYPQKGNKDFTHPLVSPGTVGEDLIKVPHTQGKTAATTPIKEVADKALSDVSQVRNFKLATGESGTIQALGVNRAVRTGFTGGAFDPDKVLKELEGPKADVYNEAITMGTRGNLRAFLEQAKSMQSEPSTSGGSIISMVKNRPVLSLPGIAVGGLAGGTVGHSVYGAMAGGAVTMALGDSAISKLMSDPKIAELTIQAMKTPASSQVSSVLSKAVLWGLRGTEVMVTTPDGKQEKAQVSPEGQLTYPKPQ